MPGPAGRSVTAMQPLRFAIHHHTGYGADHWDMMLEVGDNLRTFQLTAMPTGDRHRPIPAERIADHRKAYLTYEGPVSRGRGRVAIVASGTYETLNESDDEWTIRFDGGEGLIGTFTLVRREPKNVWPELWELRPARG